MAEVDALQLYNHFLANVFPVIHKISALSRYADKLTLQNHPNPLVACGGKVYSQNDEDGIIFEILRRLGIAKGVFAEFGVGSGTENNTLALAAAGWSGFWVGGEDLAFDFNPGRAAQLNFHYRKEWVKRSNILDLYRRGLQEIRQTHCTLLSIDLDGNDLHFVRDLLEAGILPEVFVVEYNAKFIPPIRFTIDYDEEHRWQGDDYFGASLASFHDLFEAHGYFLACCNLTGSNAFFIRKTHKALFADVPEELDRLYASGKYFLTGLDVTGHPISMKTIETIFARLNSGA